MANRRRDIQLNLYLYPEEKEMLVARSIRYGFKSVSAYIRATSVFGKMRINNYDEIKRMNKELNAIGVNVNQLVRRVNTTNTVYKTDLDDLKNQLDKIMRKQRRMMSVIYESLGGDKDDGLYLDTPD
ncbi:MAG: MobC family plasmid mobilization relaxosome protein [Eubacterium sp.]|nr:MobC family plasmid mobilization relaxosome protein [Eubacterium sp.]